MAAILRYNNSMAYARNVLSWAASYATGVVPVDLPPITGSVPELGPAMGDSHLDRPEGLGPGLPLNATGLPANDPLALMPLMGRTDVGQPDLHRRCRASCPASPWARFPDPATASARRHRRSRRPRRLRGCRRGCSLRRSSSRGARCSASRARPACRARPRCLHRPDRSVLPPAPAAPPLLPPGRRHRPRSAARPAVGARAARTGPRARSGGLSPHGARIRVVSRPAA